MKERKGKKPFLPVDEPSLKIITLGSSILRDKAFLKLLY